MTNENMDTDTLIQFGAQSAIIGMGHISPEIAPLRLVQHIIYPSILW